MDWEWIFVFISVLAFLLFITLILSLYHVPSFEVECYEWTPEKWITIEMFNDTTVTREFKSEDAVYTYHYSQVKSHCNLDPGRFIMLHRCRGYSIDVKRIEPVCSKEILVREVK